MAPAPVAVAPAPEPTPAPVVQEVAPVPTPAEVVTPVADVAPAPQGRPTNLRDYVSALMARSLEIHIDDIDPDQNIMELGADSMTAMSLVKEVETMYTLELPATLLFEYSTLNELVEYLKTEIGED